MFKSLLLKGRFLGVLLCCLVSSLVVTAQTKYKGKVIGSDDKLPVVGASVRIKGTTTGSVTDVNGEFTLSLSPGNTLVISYIGYQTTEVKVGTDANIRITLQAGNNSLNEVVVTGYGSQRKKDITGSVAIVNVTTMKSVPAGNTSSLLQGQASGVTVTNSGQPGGAASVNIRGVGSIFSTQPLIIIDGTPGKLDDINVNDIESIQVLKDAGSASIYGVRGSNGVVVVTTKKGKSGKAQITYDGLYGTTRPLSDGFKLADTKTYMEAEFESFKNDGKIGGGVNGNTNKQFDPLGTGTFTIPDYITPAGARVGAPGTTPDWYNLNPVTGNPLDPNRLGPNGVDKLGANPITLANKQGTDWFHEVFKPAPLTSHNITASGGSDKSTYLMSVGYLNQQGTLIGTYEKRYSLRANTNFNINDHVRVGENAYIFNKNNPQVGNQNEGNAISYIYREPPIIPIYDIMGNYAGSRSPGLSNSSNPVAIVQRNVANNQLRGNNQDWQIQGNLFAEVDFLKHFTARTQFGGTVENFWNRYFSPTPYENAEGNNGANSYTEYSGYNSSYTWTNTLRYDQQIGKHSIKVLAGEESINNYGRFLQGQRGTYLASIDPNYVSLDTGSPAGQTNANTRTGPNYGPYSNTIQSYFARLDYAYDDKYLLSGTIRRDGSSFFAPGHRYGTFPSATVGWRLSKEDFMKGANWINDLKLRAGYGSLGSLSGVQTQPYNAFNLYTAGAGTQYYDIEGKGNAAILGSSLTQVGNPLTTWETDKELNVGIDATIINNALDFSFEYYKKTTSGLLFQSQILAPGAILHPPYVNAGDLRNTGFDASVNYHGSINAFKFNVGLNFSHYSNLVKSLNSGQPYLDVNSGGSTRLQNFVRLQPGQPVGEFFGYQVLGLYQSQADVDGSAKYPGAVPGLFKLKDVNGDGKIDASDRTFIGNPNPKFTGGLNLNGSYKGFDFSAFFYGVYGNKVANYVKYWTSFPAVFDGNVSSNIITDSWHPGADNSHATIPILTRQANLGNTGAFNSFYIENGSFLRLKSLQIGYTFPTADLAKIGVSKLRIFVLGNNLFTITKYSGLDPELQNSNLNNSTSGDNTSFGIDFGNYPANEKRYSIGLQATF
ncbi:TonB-linked outer membrane protein, SusC/RagA family [Mucilaginibacter sp. OK268]|uniref:SusC/RagA family TonB-linked outer membrane protein n=1 Tax=Mucilaginibacter sp. OK268 TaxID=1881048 RepID=UPI00087ECFAC|nr:TonB-dependent receptor [Mucilaginibacter sp. OK268]SDP59153.1 TonB-linked outer membrane protein, SusC/RagA family [Mucilaginibacter sp. OK268]